MKKSFSIALALVFGTVCMQSSAVTDIYKFSMHLKIPRVYENTQSQGYRQYQWQTVEGELRVQYDEAQSERPTVEASNVVNRTYIVGGKRLIYIPMPDEGKFPKVNLIGSNKKSVFKTPSISIPLCLYPSYNINDKVTEDNSLFVDLGGTGTTSKKKVKGCQVINSMKGAVTGRLGCSCTDYGHMSPTRVAGYKGPVEDQIDDVAAVWGSWKAVWKRREP